MVYFESWWTPKHGANLPKVFFPKSVKLFGRLDHLVRWWVVCLGLMTPFLKCLKKGGIAMVEYIFHWKNQFCAWALREFHQSMKKNIMKCVTKSIFFPFVNFKHTKKPGFWQSLRMAKPLKPKRRKVRAKERKVKAKEKAKAKEKEEKVEEAGWLLPVGEVISLVGSRQPSAFLRKAPAPWTTWVTVYCSVSKLLRPSKTISSVLIKYEQHIYCIYIYYIYISISSQMLKNAPSGIETCAP